MRRIIALSAAVLVAACGAVLASPGAFAYSECTTRYTPEDGTYSDGYCMATQFRLDASDAPDRVTGTIGYKNVDLSGGYSVSGRYGAQKVRLTDNSVAGLNWSGTVGRKKVRMSDQTVYGIECIIGGSTYRVSSGLVDYTEARITDGDLGALCLALVLAVDAIDDI